MRESEPVALGRAVEVVEIPAGTRAVLPAGAAVLVTQTLGGNYTVMTTDGALYRVDRKDADALGHEAPVEDARLVTPTGDGPVDEALVWDQLRTVYDPEIPVNIVDLGLVYRMDIVPLPAGGNRIDVEMTMTAPGCGMGEFLKADAEEKLHAVPGVREVHVEIVWEPAWDRDRMSEAAKLQLGML
jgi:probable FeS assembly SUF system protein SufT